MTKHIPQTSLSTATMDKNIKVAFKEALKKIIKDAQKASKK